MSPNQRLIVCGLASVVGHVAFARALGHLPRRQSAPAPRVVSIRVVAPPPPEPELPKAPALPALPTPIPTQPPSVVRARVRSLAPPARVARPTEAPPPDQASVPGNATGSAPVFGVSMESTSQGSNGPAMPVGSTARPQAGASAPRGGGTPKGSIEPVPAYQVTTMPLPQGRCVGKYTDEARAAGVEGTVVLDLVVGDDGRTRDIRVISGLGHGLTEAAVQALTACRFSPGEKDGIAVPVRLRGFKIRFLMQDGD